MRSEDVYQNFKIKIRGLSFMDMDQIHYYILVSHKKVRDKFTISKLLIIVIL